uniref:RRM domain-containing protein n=1 Tax=Glossina morsitans morsitans TaxID=37546 RepID=A0A1B0FLC1_GLOMM
MKQKQVKINPKAKKHSKQSNKELGKKIIGQEGETNDSEDDNVTVGAVMQTKRPAKKAGGKAVKKKEEDNDSVSEDEDIKVKPVTKKVIGKVVKTDKKKKERVEASDSDATEDTEDEDNVSKDDSVVIETANGSDVEDDDSNDDDQEIGSDDEVGNGEYVEEESDEDDDDEEEDQEKEGEEDDNDETPIEIPIEKGRGKILNTSLENKKFAEKSPGSMKESDMEEVLKPRGARCQSDKAMKMGNLATSVNKEEPSESRQYKSYIIVEGIESYTNQNDLKKHFASCGIIGNIRLIKSENISCAYIFFKSPSAATKALKLDKSILNGHAITVKPQKTKYVFNPKNTVSVINCKKLTTLDIATLERIFAKCGFIDEIHVLCMPKILAFVTFKNEEGLENALRLNGKTEEGLQLKIELCKKVTTKNDIERNATRSISLINCEQLESVDSAKLETIFSKCGTIENMRVVCGKNILAFITFIDEEAVENALKLNGETEEGLKLVIEKYKKLELHQQAKPNKSFSVLVNNLTAEVTVPDLYKLFSQCGDVSGVQMKFGKAVVNFKTADAFCKSFLLHETKLKNREIYLQPYTEKKVFLQNKALGHGKRPFTPHFPSSNGGPKRFKRKQ